MAVEYQPKKNIVLIGFMGSGKTTIGTRLAFRYKRVCKDTDALLEKKAGKSINEIFAQEGEEAFRQMETQLLQELCDKGGEWVYSVGGGTPVKQVNQELLKKLGIVVYLKVKPETVYQRLQGDTTRPLLACDDPQSRIRELMEAREEAYQNASDFVVSVDELSADEIIDEIMMGIRRRNK